MNGKKVWYKLEDLKKQKAQIFFFTGTGNTLLLAQEIADEMSQNDWEAELRPMESANDLGASDTLLGLVFPVACFSTYPVVLRFIDALPEGKGRRVFLAASMGGAGLGMEGPIKKLLLQKGYTPLASQFFTMPGNYGQKQIPTEENAKRMGTALPKARAFARALMQDKGHWGNGVPLISALLSQWGHSRKPWKFFYGLYPLAVSNEKCTQCGLCIRLCPSGAIHSKDGYPFISPDCCDSCQRCVGFCPVGAIHVPGKPAVRYRAMEYSAFAKAFKEGKRQSKQENSN